MTALLIGGTSHVGKSTVAHAVAARLGLPMLSTDSLARHPGRPWRTPEREVPPHVAEHYGSLTVDELVTSVLGHYERLWPRIEDVIGTSVGLVVEGSALWPELVARSSVPGVSAVWLTADPELLRARIHQTSGYADATDEERRLVTMFLARTERYQTLMGEALDRLGLRRLAVGAGTSVQELATEVIAGREAGGGTG